jgi:hypothetical protein
MAPIPSVHPRIITYYQTHHHPDGTPISVLPLISQPGISLTHLILVAIHINHDPNGITLNEHHPSHPRFVTLWAELRILQASGIKVLGMLGGAAKGTYTRLDSETGFNIYYPPLRDLIKEHGLDGLDLDVEEEMSLEGIIRLIDALKADFGKDFIITLAPVASALLDHRRNLSGFDYEALEVYRGHSISFYNAQFYCGWGDCASPLMYERILARGWPEEKIVVGLVTNPENGSGWLPWEVLGAVVPVLCGRHPRFGGVMGWEYFNSLPGGREKPWEWARWMTVLLRGERTVWDALMAGKEITYVKEGDKGQEQKKIEPVPGPTEGVGKKAEEGDEGEGPVPEPFQYYSDGSDGEQ